MKEYFDYAVKHPVKTVAVAVILAWGIKTVIRQVKKA